LSFSFDNFFNNVKALPISERNIKQLDILLLLLLFTKISYFLLHIASNFKHEEALSH
jgi:hypothetical protein